VRIAVLGAGAWGTALAISAASRHDVVLWARDTAQAESMHRERSNARYLAGVAFPAGLQVTADKATAWAHGNGPGGALTVLAAPVAALRSQLAELPDDRPVLWLCKGFEAGSGALGHEVAHAVRPASACGVLSGPSFALEVARAQPTALVVASVDPALRDATVAAFHGEHLRVYSSADVVGVEVGGAVKNVMAIATGILESLPSAGLNARAALITRGLAEMTRLGLALGAQADTFMGLSGLGDLVLTATGSLSRNRRVGLQLGSGQPLAEVMRNLGHVAEGVLSAPTVVARARRLGVEMPISEAVLDVLEGRLGPMQAMAELMSRNSRAEGLQG
jgi:glycerol-3-phosphate dehydrogenase (NAD(P)+)